MPQAFLDIAGVAKRYGASTVLDGCSLAVARGEIVTLLGPSGCGKTTLLRCIAGLAAPDEGAIDIEGADILAVPVNRRPVGVVFQNYALFPHLSVAGNIAYGLRMRRVPKAEIATRVAAAVELAALGGLEQRWPAQLSGGQQQRVAIARVLVLEPKVLLLDEPFNALDAKLRGGMQVELRRLIKRLGMTAIFVTHDQDEALAISDRIAVMRGGRIEQVGAPTEIYDSPATAYVADFIGLSNMLPARAADGQVALPGGVALPTDLRGDVVVMVRPQNFALAPAEAPAAGPAPWRGRIAFGRPAGATMEYEVETDDGPPLKVAALREGGAATLPVGTPVAIALRDPASCVVFARGR